MTSKTEEEKVHKYIFVEKKNGEGKGGVYLKKEYIFFVGVGGVSQGVGEGGPSK